MKENITAVEALSKEPWNDPNSIWRTKSEYFTWLRGNLRKIWSDYPLRKEWKKNSLRPVSPDERAGKVFHPSTKNVGQCVFCKKWFPGSKLEVDHKDPSSCMSHQTAEEFLWHCAGSLSDEFQLACVPCHKIKSYQEQHGMTFREAMIEKVYVIPFGKMPAARQAETLNAYGVSAKNATERKDKYREIIKHALKEEE